MDARDLVQLLATGISEGSMYGLMALGFTLLFKCTNVISFAQGEFAVLGSLVMVTCSEGLALPLALSFLLTIASVALVGAVFELTTIRPLIRGSASVLNIIIATIGVSMVLRTIAKLAWGREPLALPAFGGDKPIEFLQAFVHPQTPWILGLSMLILGGMIVFLDYTRPGRALKACAEDAFAAKLMGISSQRVVLASVVLSAALGAASGILIAPVTYAQYDLGVVYTMKGFSAAVVGGIENPLGAMVGGIFLGLLETFGVFFLSSGYKDVITLGVLLLVLFVMPEGIFSTTGRRS